MDKKKLEEARSIITSALTPNNKKGMTAAELDEEIYALMGARLSLPPGCPGLDAFIQKYLSDEFCAVPTYGGLVYKLIPKADTDYLLRLVARQNDNGSKPLYVAEQAKQAAKMAAARARGGSSSRGSRGGRGSFRGGASRPTTMQRLGPPPRLQSALANTYNNAPARPMSSAADWAMPPPSPAWPSKPNNFFSGPPSYNSAPSPLLPSPLLPSHMNGNAFQRAISQAGQSNQDISMKRPMSIPPPLSMPPASPTPVSSFERKFNDLFERYKACKANGKPMEIACKLSNSKTKLAQTDFPQSLEELFRILDAFVNQCASQNKLADAPSPAPSTVNGTTNGGQSSSGSILPANLFPPIGRTIRGVVARLESFEKFYVQLPSYASGGHCPCTLFAVTFVDANEALQMTKSYLATVENKVDVSVKAHKPTHVEVDLLHVESGASLISVFVKKGLVTTKADPAILEALPQLRNLTTFPISGAASVPTTDQFTVRVSAVINASVIGVNLVPDVQKLVEIENALSSAVKKTKVRPEDVTKNSFFAIRTSQFCRVRVLDSWNNNEVALRLIDHGTTVTVTSLEELFPLPDSKIILQTPPLAFYLSLSGLQHKVFKADSCAFIAEKELLGKTCNVRVVDRQGKVPSVELVDKAAGDASETINDKVSKAIFAELKPSMTVGNEFSVYLRFIDWINQSGREDIRLHLQMIGVGSEILSAVEAELPSLYENGSTAPSTVSQDSEYAAPYLGEYYRCRPLTIKPDKAGSILVLFYDYGNVENVALKDMRPLEAKYSCLVVPPQAVATRLSGLPPPGKQWISKATDLVFAMFESGREYIAKAISIEDDGCYVVELREKSATKTINEELAGKPELFEPLQQQTQTLAVNGYLSSALEVKSNGEILSAVSTDESTLTTEAVPKFVTPAMTLAPFGIDQSYDPSDGSICCVALNFEAPGKFGCQLIPNDELNEMVASMNTFYTIPSNRIRPAVDFKVGDVGVVCQNGVYYRAQVLSAGKYSYNTRLVDFASDHIANKDKMFLLEAKFANLQPLGFELRLDNVPQSKTGHYPSALTQLGESLIPDEQNVTLLKVFPVSNFNISPPLNAVATVSGRIKIYDTGVDVGEQFAQLIAH